MFGRNNLRSNEEQSICLRRDLSFLTSRLNLAKVQDLLTLTAALRLGIMDDFCIQGGAKYTNDKSPFATVGIGAPIVEVSR